MDYKQMIDYIQKLQFKYDEVRKMADAKIQKQALKIEELEQYTVLNIEAAKETHLSISKDNLELKASIKELEHNSDVLKEKIIELNKKNKDICNSNLFQIAEHFRRENEQMKTHLSEKQAKYDILVERINNISVNNLKWKDGFELDNAIKEYLLENKESEL